MLGDVGWAAAYGSGGAGILLIIAKYQRKFAPKKKKELAVTVMAA